MVSPAAPHNPRQQQTHQSSNHRSSLPAPLAPVFYILNWIAFTGWCNVLYHVVSFYFYSSSHVVTDKQNDGTGAAVLQLLLLQRTKSTLVLLEGICAVEVGRIFFKDLPGSLTLGVILHTIRITALLQVLPRAVALAGANDSTAEWTWTVPLVLLSWAVTEVGRYPMYLAPSNDTCRKIRMILPLVTFPIGAFAEFCAAYQVFFGSSNNNNNVVDPGVPLWLQFLLVVMMLVNGVLGPYLAYPHLLKKGLPVLGLSVGRSASVSSSSSTTNKKPKLRSV